MQVGKPGEESGGKPSFVAFDAREASAQNLTHGRLPLLAGVDQLAVSLDEEGDAVGLQILIDEGTRPPEFFGDVGKGAAHFLKRDLVLHAEGGPEC